MFPNSSKDHVMRDYENSKSEFKKYARRVAIKNFPTGTQKSDIQQCLSGYRIETIHTDKSGESCKVVFKDTNEAKQCIENIRGLGENRGYPGLEGSYTASDFMICVSHFPLDYNEQQFKELISKYGETEKCFLVRSQYLDYQPMGYGFLEFTAKGNAIKARNELHGEVIWHKNKKYRLQVHWISKIPDTYAELQSSTIYCQGWKLTKSQLRELLNRHDVVYFDISNLEEFSENFAIVQYDTHELAADMVQFLRKTSHDIQVSFSIPRYSGEVLLKSFETFYKTFIKPNESKGMPYVGNGLLGGPPNSPKLAKPTQMSHTRSLSSLPSSQSFSTDSSSPTLYNTPSDQMFAEIEFSSQLQTPHAPPPQVSQAYQQQLQQLQNRNALLEKMRHQSATPIGIVPDHGQRLPYGISDRIPSGHVLDQNNNPCPRFMSAQARIDFQQSLMSNSQLRFLSEQRESFVKREREKLRLQADLFGKSQVNSAASSMFQQQLSQEHPKPHDMHQYRDQLHQMDDRTFEPDMYPLHEKKLLQNLPLPPTQPHRRRQHIMKTPPKRRQVVDEPMIMDSPEPRHLLGSNLMHQINSPSRESWDSPTHGLRSLSLGSRPDSRTSDMYSRKRPTCMLDAQHLQSKRMHSHLYQCDNQRISPDERNYMTPMDMRMSKLDHRPLHLSY